MPLASDADRSHAAGAGLSRSPAILVADTIDNGIRLICRAMVLVTMTALLGLLGANVLARYIFAQGGFTWVGEIPELLFPWLIAAGVVLAVQHGAHIAFDILLGMLGRSGQRVLMVFINLLVAAAYLVLTRTALQLADIAAIERSPILEVPRSIGYYALTFAAVLMAVSCLTIAIRVAVIGPEAAPQPNPEDSVT